MAKRDPPAEEGALKTRHKYLVKALFRYLEKVEVLIDELEAGEEADLAQTREYVRKLISTSKQLLDAEIEIDADYHRKRGGSPLHGAPINMQAARDALGERLDSLRNGGGSGEISKST